MGSADAMRLKSTVDTHVHTSPDILPRAQTAVEVARNSMGAQMAAVVLKSHHCSTVALAHAANEVVDGVRIFGGLVLNRSACGGFNSYAVEAALAMGARIIWMPTISARNHIKFVKSGHPSSHVAALSRLSGDGLSPLDERGRVIPEVVHILDLVAERHAVLATGHLSTAEICGLLDTAHKCGVSRILVTHPEAPMIRMPIDVQRELASTGAFFERCYYSILAGDKPQTMLNDIRSVGVSSTIAATDLGQAHHPAPVEGFRAYRDVLEAEGLTEEEWHAVAVKNPSDLFGLCGR